MLGLERWMPGDQTVSLLRRMKERLVAEKSAGSFCAKYRRRATGARRRSAVTRICRSPCLQRRRQITISKVPWATLRVFAIGKEPSGIAGGCERETSDLAAPQSR